MKTIETIKKENAYIALYDLIEDKLEAIRKANGWRKWTDERYDKAMKDVAKELEVDADELKEYFED